MLQNQHRLQIVAAETAEHAAHQHTQSKPKRRVVVTGMGCVTSLGHDPKEFYDNLLEVCLTSLVINHAVPVSPTQSMSHYQVSSKLHLRSKVIYYASVDCGDPTYLSACCTYLLSNVAVVFTMFHIHNTRLSALPQDSSVFQLSKPHNSSLSPALWCVTS